ncbi:MAG: hypothetical protein QOG63_120, partial [Thermoleophilaceae bacterium]|nr:hypothetical protein [Thermoleophilaceae bacterium]
KGAVPPSGITGATFLDGRLFVAGTEGDKKFEVWSIDLTDGSRRLEIERDVIGESEGLDNFDAAGGTLHWLIQPFTLSGRPPTYPPNEATLLHFVPGSGPGPGPGPGPGSAHTKLRLRVTPSRVRAGERVRSFVARVVTGDGRTVKGARVTLAGHAAKTGAGGRVGMKLRLRTPGKYLAQATRTGMQPGRRTVHALGRRAGKRVVTPPPAG